MRETRMRIEFRNFSQMGNNVRVEMFFSDIRTAEVHCTPTEYRDFVELLHAGQQTLGFASEDLITP